MISWSLRVTGSFFGLEALWIEITWGEGLEKVRGRSLERDADVIAFTPVGHCLLIRVCFLRSAKDRKRMKLVLARFPGH